MTSNADADFALASGFDSVLQGVFLTKGSLRFPVLTDLKVLKQADLDIRHEVEVAAQLKVSRCPDESKTLILILRLPECLNRTMHTYPSLNFAPWRRSERAAVCDDPIHRRDPCKEQLSACTTIA